MSANAVHPSYYAPTEAQQDYSMWQRLILRRAHPWAMICDSIAAIWGLYFLARHDWLPALLVAVAGRVLGLALTRHADIAALGQTLLGRLALLHLHPTNAALQLAGAIGLIGGVWVGDSIVILAGISVILVGHAVGWSQVHPAFAIKKP